jgi:hypothetical protein
MENNNKDKIKEQLTIEQVMDLVAELGGEPRLQQGGEYFTAKTICHGGNSHKLYYYNNTHLFRCYTECSPEIFDIYEGDRIDSDKKSIAFNLTFSDPSKTLSEEEVMTSFNNIIKDVESKCNAKLRDK